MIKVDLSNLPSLSATDANLLVGVEEEEFSKPGVYHILVGSRGEIEELEFLGEATETEIPSLEELQDEADDEDFREELAEFYGLSIEEDHINFGYTEEGYDVWLRIA